MRDLLPDMTDRLARELNREASRLHNAVERTMHPRMLLKKSRHLLSELRITTKLDRGCALERRTIFFGAKFYKSAVKNT